MNDLNIVFFLGIGAGAVVGSLGPGCARRLWKWLKFNLWWNYRYAAGYRKGLAAGRQMAWRVDAE